MSLKTRYSSFRLEAGCDEAGRGCLAGPVFAAAVILPDDYLLPGLNDSKKLSEAQREKLCEQIENQALAAAVASGDIQTIDRLNILWASVDTMHKALSRLVQAPEFIAVDGNKFLPFGEIPHRCIIKGDAKYAHIAAASILAKVHRDRHMKQLHPSYPEYGWDRNKGYPTRKHRQAISQFGPTPIHRKSFRYSWQDSQMKISDL